jgi:hypothetical protein
MAKRFTLDEAQALIPQVTRYVREAIEIKSEYEAAERAIRQFTERVMLMGGLVVDRGQAILARTRRETAAARLRNSIEQIQGLGCVVKDLDIGLVDFPTLFRGSEVYLCWKLGEPGIEYWHGVDEGFRGRKYIDQDFRDHHKGESSFD